MLSKKIKHSGNLVARVYSAGNVKPDKEQSREKIDGMLALIMALYLVRRHPEKKSVYEKTGLRSLKTWFYLQIRKLFKMSETKDTKVL